MVPQRFSLSHTHTQSHACIYSILHAQTDTQNTFWKRSFFFKHFDKYNKKEMENIIRAHQEQSFCRSLANAWHIIVILNTVWSVPDLRPDPQTFLFLTPPILEMYPHAAMLWERCAPSHWTDQRAEPDPKNSSGPAVPSYCFTLPTYILTFPSHFLSLSFSRTSKQWAARYPTIYLTRWYVSVLYNSVSLLPSYLLNVHPQLCQPFARTLTRIR